VARRPASLAAWTAGNNSAMSMLMMVITTNSSTNVKPVWLLRFIEVLPIVRMKRVSAHNPSESIFSAARE
jgi:hypothetical protein